MAGEKELEEMKNEKEERDKLYEDVKRRTTILIEEKGRHLACLRFHTDFLSN